MSRPLIGFTQRIQLEWLEWTAQMALTGLTDDEIYAELQERLRPIVSVGGDDYRSNRGKVVGILLKIWVKVSAELKSLRDEGLELLAESPAEDHLAVHWGMSLATYPFFGTVVDAVGRLLQLQGTVTFAQVNRRVQEKYGQRESIKRGTERAFYALHDWGVLEKSDERTVYTRSRALPVSMPQLATWLIEAGMITAGVQSTPVKTAGHMAVLFPFSLTAPCVVESERLELFRQGLDHDFIIRTGVSQ